MRELRVIDAGRVGPRRSQALWHGIAEVMPVEAHPTLSFCTPSDPYVCLGLHRSLHELDLAQCASRGLPVLRRQIGGGPVYLDSDQLFFQITVPVRSAPPRIDQLYERFLGPAVDAFRALGLDAALDGLNDIVVHDRKISGTGAGQIEDAVTVVGNVIFAFPHERMAEVLAVPTNSMRSRYLELMRRHVSSLVDEGLGGVTPADARAALIEAYASALGATAVAAEPSEAEEHAIGAWERRVDEPSWLEQSNRRPNGLRTVKVSARAWVFAANDGDVAVEATVIDGTVRDAHIGPAPGRAAGETAHGEVFEEMSARVRDVVATREGVEAELSSFGDTGRRAAELLGRGFASTTH